MAEKHSVFYRNLSIVLAIAVVSVFYLERSARKKNTVPSAPFNDRVALIESQFGSGPISAQTHAKIQVDLSMNDALMEKALASKLQETKEGKAALAVGATHGLVNLYLNKEADANQPSQAELSALYEAFKKEGAMYHIAQLAFPTQAEAQAALERHKKGESFADVAKSSTDKTVRETGGNIGWVNLTLWEKATASKIQNLQPNETTEVLPSKYGFLIIKLLEAPKIPDVYPPMNDPDVLKALTLTAKANHKTRLLEEAVRK